VLIFGQNVCRFEIIIDFGRCFMERKPPVRLSSSLACRCPSPELLKVGPTPLSHRTPVLAVDFS
jgi:hypothetical protein